MLFQNHYQAMFLLDSALLSVTPLYSTLFPPKIVSKNYSNSSSIITSLPMKIIVFIYGVKDPTRFSKIHWKASFKDTSIGYTTEASRACLLNSVFVHSCLSVHFKV